VSDPDLSRRRFLARAGVLGAAPLIGLVKVEDALASPPPTVYDVTTYGAQGDGTTDDSNALQAAVDAAPHEVAARSSSPPASSG
jgi:predicted trehalose synthase